MTANTDANAAPRAERHAAETGNRETRVIEVRELTKHFGDVVAVDGLSFEISRGSIVGFLGPNGAGKTTTLRMLLGLIEPTSGSATIDGRAYRELSGPLREVGALLEASSFHPGRTARSHLRVQADAARVARSRVDDVLELVDLAHAADRRVAGFSLGMRQRLGLATALLPDPQILILDEPANGLDPEGVRWLRDLLRGLADRGRTVLVSSHVLAEVAQTVQSVIILHRGRLVVHQPLSELTAGARRVVHVRTPGAGALREAIATIGGEARITGPDRLDVGGASAEEIATLAARHQIPIFEIGGNHPSLEEVFLELTATGADAEAQR
jgi:ABC-2 type transport system ATP-binding protein